MNYDIVLIGDPVAHSLSPIMHNTAYFHMGQKDWHYRPWSYHTVQCVDEESARQEIGRVRTGHYLGMNVTMPYKQLALRSADYIDAAADAAGGANVLVRKGFKLHAFNTDGLGAVGAIARVGGMDPHGKKAVVCGTGPTSMAIACSLANSQAREVVVFSRDYDKARAAVDRLELSVAPQVARFVRAADYGDAERIVPAADVFVDATPRGMQPDDEPIVDPSLFHEGQVVFDVVYGHGLTRLVAGAREAGATALDGVEMLVEQAALSIEIWAEAIGLSVVAPRDVMRAAALGESRKRQDGTAFGEGDDGTER